MAYHKISNFEKTLTHAVLVLGSLAFAFPFIWMLSTSFKVNREMAVERIKVFPKAPWPVWQSPYIDPTEFDPPERPDGIPAMEWKAVRPRLEEALDAMVAAWKPQTLGPVENVPPAPVASNELRSEMVEGLIATLGARISDSARQKAIEVERNLRQARGDKTAGAPDVMLAESLSQEAIEAGVQAILADARRLVDGKMLQDTLEACYRRICLGKLRIRTRDYQSYSLFTGNEWRVAEGPAELVARIDKASPAQEMRVKFTPEKQTARLVYDKPLPVKAADVNRVYVSYRGDAAWASMRFEVIRAGRLYRSPECVNLFEGDWLEQELRWPGDDEDAMARRVHITLEPAGPAPAGSPEFAVQLVVRKNSLAGAWWAKLSRNYITAFKEIPFARYIMTSLSLSILNIVLTVFSCTLVAFAFARLAWPGRDLCFAILLATMMIPPQVTMVPGFLVFKHLGWYNSLLPLWVPAAFGSSFFIFLLRQFFKNIPGDLEDAARIDGCGVLRIYWHVMMPLVKPTIATISIYTFMGVWNNFMGPLIFVNDDRLFPLALGLFKFSLRSGADNGLMMAGAFIMTMPVIMLFFFVQRYFIQGISLTGVKG